MRNVIVGAAVSAGLALLLPLQAGENRSEPVDQKELPEAVQKTIQKHAAGGEIVRVQREDDSDGRWNYEVMVKSNGKEWGFEVDPKGRFVKKH